jgi:hypothetical protein
VVTLLDAFYFVIIAQETLVLQFFCLFFLFFLQKLQLKKNQNSSPSPVQEDVWMGSCLRIKMCWPHPLQSDKLMQPMVRSRQQPARHRVVRRVRPQESLSSAPVEVELIRLVFFNYTPCNHCPRYPMITAFFFPSLLRANHLSLPEKECCAVLCLHFVHQLVGA